MRPPVFFTAAGIAALVVAMLAPAIASAGLTLVNPANKTVTTSELLNVVVKLDKPDEFDRVGIGVRNKRDKEPHKLSVAVKRPFVCKTVHLSLGLNQIVIAGLKGGKRVEEKKYVVYYRSDLSERHREAPPEFKRNVFHVTEREKDCAKCHTMTSLETDAMPPAPDKSTCFSCHEKITKYKFVHGPSSVWSCPSCHGTDAERGKYGVVQPDSELCGMCHEEMMTEWSKKSYRHGPSMMSCTICHNPHGSDQPFFVHFHTTSLCVGCHAEKESGTHVVVGFGGGGHPTRGRPDPIRKDREFTCAGCHNPHAGDTENLLYFDNSGYGFCANCHKK